jgi:hypothetical protein
MSRDWHAWHDSYDDPSSSLSRRLEVVRDLLRSVLVADPGARRLISLCSGDGRDVLPVLADTAPYVRAVLVELDPALARRAQATATALGLGGVIVHTGDAGTTDSYRDAVPADVVMACGVFGNVAEGDVERTVQMLPALLRAGGVVIWTRGSNVRDEGTQLGRDESDHVRDVFGAAGFEELTFVRPEDAGFRVGVHRLARPADDFVPGLRMFTFV